MQSAPAPIAARQSARCCLADVPHAQGIDESFQRHSPSRLYGRKQLTNRDLAEAFMRLEPDLIVARLEREDVGGLFHHTLLEKQRGLLFAQPLDVKGMSRDEVPQVLNTLMGAGKLPGAAGDRAFFSRSGPVPHDVSLERTRAHLPRR